MKEAKSKFIAYKIKKENLQKVKQYLSKLNKTK